MQRAVIWPLLRRTVAQAAAAMVDRIHPATELMIGEGRGVADEVREGLALLEKQGYAVLPNILSDQQIAEINTYLSKKEVMLRSGVRVDLARIPASATLADLPLEDVVRCPNVIALANNPRLIRLAVRFLKCVPTISTIGIRWSFPGRYVEASTQAFHRDTDDWRFFKFFVYLTDVDETSGPHLYVPGSHLTAGTVRARKFSEQEITLNYGANALVAITGRAGTNFVMNGYGIHAGPLPAARLRLMLEIGYSVLPSFVLDYRPIRLDPRPNVDAYINRLLLA